MKYKKLTKKEREIIYFIRTNGIEEFTKSLKETLQLSRNYYLHEDTTLQEACNKAYYVNEFYEHKKINVVVVLLNSGGLYFGSYRQKIDVSKEIFYLLISSAVFNSDKIKAFVYSNDLEFEFNKIDKDVVKITGKEKEVNPLVLEKPQKDSE